VGIASIFEESKVNKKEKRAFAKLLNLVLALSRKADLSDQAMADVVDIAATFEITRTDLLRASAS
jgi:hypothetical protein